MKIKQAYISESIRTFRKGYLEKYNLMEAHNMIEPIVIFGLYGIEDYRFFLQHKSKIVVVWCGTDSAMLDSEKIRIIKSKPAKHIVKSRFCSDDLKRHNIPHIILPISWQKTELHPIHRGDNIYFYGQGNAYGEKYIDEIRKRTGMNIIKASINTYSKDELLEVYKSCFMGLRLTKHDGLPNTVLELGMMGRRSIYNGGIPGSIPWKNIDDICDHIKNEYTNRKIEDTLKVSNDIKEFINIGDKWLEYQL